MGFPLLKIKSEEVVRLPRVVGVGSAQVSRDKGCTGRIEPCQVVRCVVKRAYLPASSQRTSQLSDKNGMRAKRVL